MEWEWDTYKSEDNAEKLGVTFEEATEVFDDPDALDVPDETHSEEEDRRIVIGATMSLRLVLVVYTMRGATRRLISARATTWRERERIRQRDEGDE
ncbi:MAG: BrnT family toxin [Chloroflexota bacterium]